MTRNPLTRRKFLKASGIALAASSVNSAAAGDAGEVLDIHQHVNYSGRDNAALIKHQDTMGITKTVLLPAGAYLLRESTHQGRSAGLAARIFGTSAAARLAAKHPEKFVYFANEVPDIPDAAKEIERFLKAGAVGIGELKFNLASDSKEMLAIFDLAKAYQVPVLLHFQHGMYNHGLDRFHKVLERYPSVNFIGHAQTWWGNIDKNHVQKVLYPKGKVTPGGITDRLLADYPNMFGDLSAGSGQNSLTRDEEHAVGFLDRHQDKLMYGSDCNDRAGAGAGCSGAGTLALVRKLSSGKPALRRILSTNARGIIKFG
jgi:predicted TIM-barrel fold metal-dependent hydrolase